MGNNYSTSYSLDKSWNDIQLGIDGLTFSIPTCKADISAGETAAMVFSGAEEIHLGTNIALDLGQYITSYNNENPTNTITTCMKAVKGSVAVNSTSTLNSFDFAAYGTRIGTDTDIIPTTDELSASISLKVAGTAGVSFCDSDSKGGKLITAYTLSCSTDYKTLRPIISAFIAKIQTATPTESEMNEFYDSLPVSVKFRMAFCNDAGEETYIYLDTTKLSDVVNFFSTLSGSTGGSSGTDSIVKVFASMLKK